MSMFWMHGDRAPVEMMEDALKEMRETLKVSEESVIAKQKRYESEVGGVCLLKRRICEMESAIEKLKAAK